MRLPLSDHAKIADEKLTDYLLSLSHSVGSSKAVFFRSLGFDETNFELMGERLLAIARAEDIVDSERVEHGIKYVVDGVLVGPAGRQAGIRTVWIIDAGCDEPRFVTAYPQSSTQ